MDEPLCETMREVVLRFVENELSPEESERLSRHLETCEACRALVNDIREARQLIIALPKVDIDVDRVERVITRTVEEYRARTESASKRADADTISLPLEQASPDTWRIGGIPFELELADFRVRLELEHADQRRELSQLVLLGDEGFELQFKDARMAAGTASEHRQEASGELVFESGQSLLFTLFQSASGESFLRIRDRPKGMKALTLRLSGEA